MQGESFGGKGTVGEEGEKGGAADAAAETGPRQAWGRGRRRAAPLEV